jgi:hypothetical protein
MNLGQISKSLTKIYNTLGNEWLTSNFKTEPFEFTVFVRRGDPDDLGDFVVEVFSSEPIPSSGLEYKDELKSSKNTHGIHPSVIKYKFKKLLKYIIPNDGEYRSIFEIKLMDIEPALKDTDKEK